MKILIFEKEFLKDKQEPWFVIVSCSLNGESISHDKHKQELRFLRKQEGTIFLVDEDNKSIVLVEK